jgi:hypothetical protein
MINCVVETKKTYKLDSKMVEDLIRKAIGITEFDSTVYIEFQMSGGDSDDRYGYNPHSFHGANVTITTKTKS